MFGLNETSRITPWQLSYQYLPALFQTVEEELVKTLQQVDGVAITYDAWTDRSSRKYLFVSCHFLNLDWVPTRKVLGIVSCDSPMTIEWIRNQVRHLFETKLGRNVPLSTICTDGASNMLGSASEVQNEDTIWCAAHRLHLIVTQSIESDSYVSSIVTGIRAFCSSVHRSTNMQSTLRTQTSLMLIIDAPTRWNSTLNMLQRFLDLYPDYFDLASIDATCIPSLPEVHPSILSSLIDVLTPMKDVTINFQGEGVICDAASWLNYLSESLETALVISPVVLRRFIETLQAEFSSRFDEELTTPSLVMRSLILIPRNRPVFVSPELWKTSFEKLVEDIEFLYPVLPTTQEQQHDPNSLLSRFTTTNLPQVSSEALKLIHALEIYRRDIAEYAQAFEQSQKSVIEFWQNPPDDIKPLQVLVRFLFSAPISSAAAESFASVMGRVKTQFRGQLSSQKLIEETIVCLNSGLFQSTQVLFERSALKVQKGLND